MFANNYISTIVENQLPEFIRTDHPNFVALLKKYYEYTEQEGNTVQVGKNLYDYMDIDTTKDTLIRYLKDKLIPNFPEETELSTAKIVKAARTFYAKKGTPESFKFIFRVLYGEEVDVYFPKEDILKASDGKWKQPQALRLSISDTLGLVSGGNVNVSAVTATSVNANGINFVTSGITANSYIQIGSEKRKVINVSASSINVEIAFANTSGNTSPTYKIYDTQKFYKVTPSEYDGFDINLLEKHLATGETSRTTCVIESAVRSVDKETGKEIVELYVSNATRLFDPGENLIIDYEDENGDSQTFKSKIVSLISNIYLYRNRFKTVQSGTLYRTGDPVVIYGGLNNSQDAVKAIAEVNNVSTGSIQSVSLLNPGYLFRAYANSLIRITSPSGIGANITIDAIWEDTANSSNIAFNTDSVFLKRDITFNNVNGYSFDNVTTTINLTAGAGNTTSIVNINTSNYAANTTNDYYKSFVLQIVGGTGAAGSPNSAVIASYSGTTKRATLATALAIAPDATSNIRIFANAQTEIGRAMTFSTLTLGKIRLLDLIDGGSFFGEAPTSNNKQLDAISLFDSDLTANSGFYLIPSGQFSQYNKTAQTIRLNSSNSSYSLSNGYYTGSRLFLDVGKTAHYAIVTDYVVTDAGSTSNVKTVYLDRIYDNNINEININQFNLFFDYRPDVRGTGKLGTILVSKGGTGYTGTDFINFIGTGYSGNASITVNGSGAITAVTITDRGGGYAAAPTPVILNSTGTASAGSGAELSILLLSDGENIETAASDIGKIQDFHIINRGFNYANTPVVSLKVADILAQNLSSGTIVLGGDSVWQGGATNAGATFQATVDEVYRPDTTNTVIRVFNYSGSINTSLPLQINTSSGNVSTVNVLSQNATISFNDVNSAEERKYPVFYGDGLAKANAEFLNGLIKYNGFYLNTDGFPSADKKLQNKDYYHNFSYEISSEKSLDNYKETINRVAHPAGMQLLSKYVMKDVVFVNNGMASNLHTSNSANTTNANTNYASRAFYGNNSNFTTRVSNGDIIVINTTETASLKQYTRAVSNVNSASLLWLESPIGGLGDGVLRITSGDTNVLVYGNTSAVTESLELGDNLQFNISSTVYDRYVTGISGNTVTVNASVSATGNVLYKKTPSYNVVSYSIIKTNG